jgi:predicted Zn-dependent protease
MRLNSPAYLGHEIGHITARHSARQQTSQIFGQVGLLAGMVLSETVRGLADETQQALGLLLLLSYSREHETESDKIGVEYSSKIGYDAHQMADFFGTLKKISEKSGQTIPRSNPLTLIRATGKTKWKSWLPNIKRSIRRNTM